MNQNLNNNYNTNQQYEDNMFRSNYTNNESVSNMGENIELINKKRYLFRDLISILDKRIDMKIVNFKMRDETDEEMRNRKQLEAEQIRMEKDLKGKKKITGNINLASPVNKNNKNFSNYASDNYDSNMEEKLQVKEISPSDIFNDSDIKYLPYIKWLMSIYQMLKDLRIRDCQTNKSVILNIYPQKDNIPCISKSGKYWIKLYFMGKPRKIEIDDLMPCNKNEDFILPSCYKLSELWPALLTKAIFKIHSYKRMSTFTEEVGDISIIYNLTGYICEKIPTNSLRVQQLTNFILSKQNYLNKYKLAAAVNFENEKISSTNKSNNDQIKSNNKYGLYHRQSSNNNLNLVSGYFSKNLRKYGKRDEETSIISNDYSDRNTTIMNNENSKVPSRKQSFILGKASGITNLFRKNNKKYSIEPENKKKKSMKFFIQNMDNQQDLNSVAEENGDIKEEKNEITNQDNNSEFNSVANNEINIQGNIFHNQNKKELDIISENNRNPDKEKGQGYTDFVNLIKKGITSSDRKRNSTGDLYNLKDRVVNLIMKNENYIDSQDYEKMMNRLATQESPLKTTKNLVNLKFEIDGKTTETNSRDDIQKNYLYPIIDYFENNKFNMTRLKPIDFSDIKRYGREEKIPGIYKQLSKEDKKKYLENLVHIKNKQKEMKDHRIKELKAEGRKYNFVKIINCTIGIPRLDFFVPFTDSEIFITKKCLENNWDFPPPSYFENYFGLMQQSFAESDNKNEVGSFSIKKKLSKKDYKKEDKYDLEIVENNDINILSENYVTEKDKNKEKDKDKNNKLNIKSNDNLMIKSGQQIVWNKDIYLSIINNNVEKYDKCIEPFNDYNGGVWMPFLDFKKSFNNYILLHSQKSFKYYLNCDNLWRNTSDCFEYDEKNAVIYLNNFVIEKEKQKFFEKNEYEEINNNTNNKNRNKNNINFNNNIINSDIKSQVQSQPQSPKNKIEIEGQNSKFNSLLVLFEPNNTSDLQIPQFFDLLQYIQFDLIDSYGNEIQKNIFLSKFYSCYFNDKLEKDRNYFLLLRSFVCPFGFNFSVFSDHVSDKMDYGTYLKKFNKFHSKTFKIEHSSLDKNSFSLIAKFKVKLLEKTYFRLKLDHEDKMLKKFVEIWLHFGKNSQIKKRLNFDLNEKILFDPLDNNDEYLFAFIVNPAYSTSEGNFDIDFCFDRESTSIELIEQIEPFVIYDKVKYDKYGIIFQEFLISGENTYATFDISINFINKNNIKNKEENENYSPKNMNVNNKISNLNLISNFNSNYLNSNNPELINKTPSALNYNNGPGKDENCNLIIFREDEIKLRMKIKVVKNGSDIILYEEEFFNRTCIHNILFNETSEIKNDFIYENNSPLSPNNKIQKKTNLSPVNIHQQKENPTYKITCTIDLNEEKVTKDIWENLDWSIKVFSNDILGISVDTGKEDAERSLKDNWENEEPGRSDRATKSRLRHLLMIKKRSGKLLTPDEEQFLKEERPRTVSSFSMMNKEFNNNHNRKDSNFKEKDKKNKNENSNTNKKNNNNNNIPGNRGSQESLPSISKIQQNEESQKREYLQEMENKPVIVNQEKHKCKFIKKFLHYTEKERLVKKDHKKEEHKSKKK